MVKPIWAILWLLPMAIWGQQERIPVNLSFFNESTAIPYTRFFTTPVHPGFQLGTEFQYNSKGFSRWYQTANVAYFYHNYLAQGVAINSEIAFEYKLKNGLAFDGLFGLGYLHTFATTEEFTFKDGQYTKKPDWGNGRIYPSLSFDVGYYIGKMDRNSPKLFLRYQAWAEYPYSPGFIPVMTHINLHIGVRFAVGKRNNTSSLN